MNMEESENLVSVIIPVWNGRPYLSDCIDSVLDQKGVALEILAVDNASADGSANWLAENYPQAHLIRNASNLGFPGACNVGIKAARGNILFLLNQDTKLRQGCLRAIFQAFADPQIGVVGCKIFYPDGRTIQHAGGKLDLPLGFTHHYGRGEPDTGAWDKPQSVDYVTGAALAFRREVVERIGLLDEGFWPGYFEDVDFCLRTRNAGYVVLYIPDAVLTHAESTAIKDGGVTLQFGHRARLRLLLKHLAPQRLLDEFVPAEDDFQAEAIGWDQGIALRKAYLETMSRVDAILRECWSSNQQTIYQVISSLRYLYERVLEKDRVLSPLPMTTGIAPLPQPQPRTPENFPRVPVLAFPEVNRRSEVPILGTLVSRFRSFLFDVLVRPAVENLIHQQVAINHEYTRLFKSLVAFAELQGKRTYELAEGNALLASELGRLSSGSSREQVIPYLDARLDKEIKRTFQVETERSPGQSHREVATMSQDVVPLTPAEQMRRIRETVLSAASKSPKDAYAVLADYFSSASALQKSLGDMESKMILKEPPPGSRLPLIGALVHKFRAIWYQVAFKWYTVPLVVQQNQCNVGTVHALRELVTITESLSGLVKEIDRRVTQLESKVEH